MSYAPAPLVELGKYYTAHGGVSLGIVGSATHTIGYHLGRDRIFDAGGPGVGAQDYSVQHARDAAGLSNAAAAFDFGRLNGSLDELQRFSRWLVSACQSQAPGSRDVREVIYSPDGERVQRWSGIDGQIHTGAGNGDATHRTHTHVSYFRDSERRSKLALVAPYFEGGDNMAGLRWTPTDPGEGIGIVTVKEKRGLVNLRTGAVGDPLHDARPSFGRVKLAEPFPPAGPGRDTGYLVQMDGDACVALDDVVLTFTPATPPELPATTRYTITVDSVTEPIVDPSP